MKKLINISMEKAYRIIFFKRYHAQQIQIRRDDLRQKLLMALS
jgi:hypothetical protein